MFDAIRLFPNAASATGGLSVIHENAPNACVTNVNCATIILLRV